MTVTAPAAASGDWHRLPPDAKARLRDRLAAKVARRRAASREWLKERRREQVPPALTVAWFVWLILAGRGWGKTRVGSETVADWLRDYPGCRVALVAETFGDGRDTMVEGESGLLAVLDPIELYGGSVDEGWNRSLGELRLANGSRCKVFTSERPGKLRGPQHHFAWGDELAKWKDAYLDAGENDTTWSNMTLGLRLKAPREHRDGACRTRAAGCDCRWQHFEPRIVVTTTPKPVALLQARPEVVAREPHRAGLVQRDSTTTTIGRTGENLANLSDAYRREVIDPVAGTRLARQELDAEILADVVGAFLSSEIISRSQVKVGELPHLIAVVTAIDPATTEKLSSAETGIVTVGADGAGDAFPIDDASGRYSPEGWAAAAFDQVIAHGSQAIVVEDNAGGDMVESVLHTAWQQRRREAMRRSIRLGAMPPIVRVHPSGSRQGKWTRAQPVQLLAEKDRLHFVVDPGRAGWSIALEDQATKWTGKPDEVSPDRVDALVHGVTWLLFPQQRSDGKSGRRKGTGHAPAERRQARGTRTR